MKDHLLDMMSHVQVLGTLDTIKITGDANSTQLDSVDAEKRIIVTGKFLNAHPSFEGVFGLPDLNRLNTILNIPEYRQDGSQISLGKLPNEDGVVVPSGIKFENATGDFKNYFRFQSENVVSNKIPSTQFRGSTWDVVCYPTETSIARFKHQSNANPGEVAFTIKTDNGNLKFYFGDGTTHTGDFVFQSGVTGNISHSWSYPVVMFQSILNVSGDKKIQISSGGIVHINVNSGLINYDYYIPALTK